jgi:hypothetical protein
MNNYENENFSVVYTKLTNKIKHWFKIENNNHENQKKLIIDLRAGNYNYWHNKFREYAKSIKKQVPSKPRNPTDFITICLLTMNDEQIDGIDEKFTNFKLDNFVENIGEDFVEGGTRCACGQVIYNVVMFKNKKTNIEFLVGTDCAEKNKIINKDKLKEIKKQIEIKKENKICTECRNYTIPKTNIDEELCKNCIKYKHYCYKCSSQYESKFKNPGSKLCNSCHEKNVKEIKYENNLWTGKDIDSLSDFNVGDTLDIDGIRFIKSIHKTNDGDYAMIIKTYDDDKIIYANTQFSIWANKEYSNIHENKNDYINTTFKKDIKVKIINKYLNTYDKYTMVLEITEVVAEYE